jgi:hypothetical protein
MAMQNKIIELLMDFTVIFCYFFVAFVLLVTIFGAIAMLFNFIWDKGGGMMNDNRLLLFSINGNSTVESWDACAKAIGRTGIYISKETADQIRLYLDNQGNEGVYIIVGAPDLTLSF